MKTKIAITGIFMVLFNLNTIPGNSQDTAKVSAYFLGSQGYLLESSTKKIALDALIYWADYNYGYIKPPFNIKEKMELCENPFDSIDLILISHAHIDHFNTQIIEKVMLKNKNAEMLIPQEVYDNFIINCDSLEVFSNRIHVPHIGFYNSYDTIIKDIPITITNLRHGSDRQMNLFTYAFEMDSIRFLHLNQWNDITSAMLDTLDFNEQRADVAFIGCDYITDNNKFIQFEKINPRFSEISHIDGASESKLNNIRSKINQYKLVYPMDLMEIPMEQLLFKKTGDTIMADTLNSSPFLKSNLKDTTIIINTPFELFIPENTFGDQDGDELILTVTLSNGLAIPDWLTFSAPDLSISGTPLSTGNLNIKVIATDIHGAEMNDIFKFTFKDISSIEETDDDKEVQLTNPASGIINVTLNGIAGNEIFIQAFDLTGKIILNKVFYNSNNFVLDFTNNPKGVYLVKMLVNKDVFYKKIWVS